MNLTKVTKNEQDGIKTQKLVLKKLMGVVGETDGTLSLIRNYFPPDLAPALGRFAPYLDRPWRRSLTPAVSNVPRMM